jgi:protein TonB
MSFRTPDPKAIRGAAMTSRLIAIVVIVIALAAGVWWWQNRQPGSPVLPGLPAGSTAPSATTSEAPAPAATVSDELTVDQLYREARKAMSENRMVAPAGNNALEYYLKILAKQPDDSGAKDALRELFPFATGAAEDQINQNAFDEANRIIALLAEADPSNYSLTILRSKLDAKKKLAEREQQQAQVAAAAAARTQAPAAAATPAPAGAPASPTPAAPAAAAPESAAPAPAPADTSAATANVATPPARPEPPPASTGETRDATVTTPPVPEYPIAAARARQEGWVEVEFTVAPDGSVQNAHVTASEPGRIFDREAVAAVQRAKFEPKLVNGQPVASTLRRRIQFKLGN